jgi:hypothetical protein
MKTKLFGLGLCLLSLATICYCQDPANNSSLVSIEGAQLLEFRYNTELRTLAPLSNRIFVEARRPIYVTIDGMSETLTVVLKDTTQYSYVPENKVFGGGTSIKGFAPIEKPLRQYFYLGTFEEGTRVSFAIQKERVDSVVSLKVRKDGEKWYRDSTIKRGGVTLFRSKTQITAPTDSELTEKIHIKTQAKDKSTIYSSYVIIPRTYRFRLQAGYSVFPGNSIKSYDYSIETKGDTVVVRRGNEDVFGTGPVIWLGFHLLEFNPEEEFKLDCRVILSRIALSIGIPLSKTFSSAFFAGASIELYGGLSVQAGYALFRERPLDGLEENKIYMINDPSVPQNASELKRKSIYPNSRYLGISIDAAVFAQAFAKILGIQ